uniref:RALY RNA binding protein like n=1 Tax=Sarcophilus harrisii TaxID=9305 RepID=A0A7N4PPI5_SARHA
IHTVPLLPSTLSCLSTFCPLPTPPVLPTSSISGLAIGSWGHAAWDTQSASLCPVLKFRLFEPRGRLSPVPRVVPVKRPRVTIPLVRRIKATLPVRLFARSSSSNSSTKLKLKCTELQTIKTELTQIKYNIEALLGRLDQISEEQSPSTDGKKKSDSKKSEAPQEDTASEAETPLEELLPGDEGDEVLAQDDFEDLDNSRYTELDELTLQ